VKRATLLVGLVLVLAGALSGQAGAVVAAPAATERLHGLDQAILARLNTTRAAHGLRPLRPSQELQNAAVFQSRSMLEGGFFAHESRDGSPFSLRLKRFYSPAGYQSWTTGENLLYKSAEISADEAIRAWLASPRHREVMLDPSWREVGIGSLHAPSAGGSFGGRPTWVITMDFGARDGSVRTKRTAAVVARG
jgi:uncharacterized protein YkwD